MSTAQDRAYATIRKAILNGQFAPGSQLRQEELAELFDMSRTAVRFAIQALADDGLVEIGDTRRSYVADVTETHAEETFSILGLLEPFSASLAAQRASPKDIAELRELIKQMDKVLELEDDFKFLELNSRFHKKIHRLSGNRALLDLIERIVDFPQTLYLKLGQSTESIGANEDHVRLVDALERGDANLAEMEMRMHIEYRRREFREQWLDFDNGSRS